MTSRGRQERHRVGSPDSAVPPKDDDDDLSVARADPATDVPDDDAQGRPIVVRMELLAPWRQAHQAFERAARTARMQGARPGVLGVRGRRGAEDRPRAGDPAPLGAIVEGLIRDNGWEVVVEVGDLVNRWADIVGADIAAHSTVESFEEGVLVVRASSTAWREQLRILRPMLLERIESQVGPGTVVKLEIRGPEGRSFKRGRLSVPGRGPRDTWG